MYLNLLLAIIINTIGSVDELIENLQLQINKICSILEKSLDSFNKFIPLSYYSPEIIKSGIKKFNNLKYYLDTSSAEGINNIIDRTSISYNKKPSRANMQPLINSVWFARMKDTNKKLFITKDDKDLISKYIFSTGFLGIKASSKLPLSLLSAFIISKNFENRKNLFCVGSTMSSINNKTFFKILVPLLSENEMKEYDKKYEKFIFLLSLYRRKIDILKNIKLILLNKYF